MLSGLKPETVRTNAAKSTKTTETRKKYSARSYAGIVHDQTKNDATKIGCIARPLGDRERLRIRIKNDKTNPSFFSYPTENRNKRESWNPRTCGPNVIEPNQSAGPSQPPSMPSIAAWDWSKNDKTNPRTYRIPDATLPTSEIRNPALVV